MITLLFSLSLLAADVPLIPRAVLFGNPEKVQPKISPDGRSLAYLAPDQGVMNIWVRTLSKSDDRAVTQDRKRGIQMYSWQPDSAHVLYVQDTGGNENFHIHQTSITTRATRDLTPFDGVRAMIVGVEASQPDFMLVAHNQRDRKVFDVYRLRFKTGDLEPDTQNPGDIAGWTADNALRVRAANKVLPGGGHEVLVRKDTSSAWQSFQKWGPEEALGGAVGFSPDNKALWMLSSVGANTLRLLEIDIESSKSKVVGEDPRFDVGGVLTHPVKNHLEAVAFVRAKTEWQFLDKAIEADFKVLEKVRDGQVTIASRDHADKTWIVSYTADVSPAAYYTYDRSAKKASFLFTARPALEKFTLAKMEPISFQARDGMMLHGYLTLPPGVSKNAPTMMLVHGGPWGRDQWGYSGLVQMLANRGYAVVQVNFRGSTGYGKDYLNAGDREWGGKMHTDILDGKQWAIRNGYADPKRVAIMGGSYGGYATLAGLAFTPDEFVCGVDIVGPSNIVTLLKTIPPYWAPMIAMFERRVGSLTKDEDFLRSRSPLFKADRIKAPLLIGQGANDPRVKQAESDQIVQAMRENKKPVVYIVFPDEGHGFVRPENSLRFWAATEEFLAKYMGGRHEQPTPAERWEPFLK
ncbi:MAG: S9 family peptidase [Bryobacteraceae bacterium]